MKNHTRNSVIKKIVLLFTLYFPPEIGGGSSGAWNRAMIFHQLGYNVFIVTSFPSYPLGKITDPKYKGKLYLIDKIEPFTVIRFRTPSLKHIGIIRPLFIFLSFVLVSIVSLPLVYKISKRPHVIYARSPVIFASLIGYCYAKIFRSYFVYEVPDLWPEELFYSKTGLYKLLNKLGILIASVSYKLPDKIVTVSKSAKEYIIRNYNPNSPVYGIPVGIDLSNFPIVTKSKARSLLKDQSLLKDNDLEKLIILYSGRISEAQNIECLLYVADKLKDIPNILFYIVGEGPDKQRIESIRKNKNLTNVMIYPAQKRETMPILISAADICTVFLSSQPIFEIALPTKFYEYLACSKPLIGICRGELADIITKNQIGEKCEIGNCEQLYQIIINMTNSHEITMYERNSKLLLRQFTISELSTLFREIVTV